MPYFRTAFVALTLIDALFLAALCYIAARLLTVNRKACILYVWFVTSMIAINLVVGGSWLLPTGVGKTIAAASGIGGMGSGPFLLYPVPFVYPILSAALVYVAYRQSGRHERVAEQHPPI